MRGATEPGFLRRMFIPPDKDIIRNGYKSGVHKDDCVKCPATIAVECGGPKFKFYPPCIIQLEREYYG